MFARHRSIGSMIALATCALLACAALFATLAGSASAAPPGSETVSRDGTLQTSGQSMWQAGAGGGPEEKTISLFDQKWNASGKGGAIVNVEKSFEVCNVWKTTEEALEKFFTKGEVTTECSEYVTISVDIGEFGAEGEASTSGEVGMSLKLHGFATGSVGVTYPVTASYKIPKAYTFAAGEDVSIDTSEEVDHTAALNTSFPTLESVELDGIFGFHAGAEGKLCVFKCTSDSLLELNLPSDYDGSNPYDAQIFSLDKPETACFDFIVNFALGFGHAPSQYDRCHNSETGVNSGYIALPNVTTSSKLEPDGSLTAEGEDPYVVVPVSAVTWAARLIPGEKPPPLNFGPAKIPGTEITLGYETLQLILTDIEKMRQVFTFTPQVDTTLQWGTAMAYTVKGSKGEVIASGSGAEATFPLGDEITLSTPASLEGALEVKPRLSMAKAEFSNDTENLNVGEGKFSALSLTLDTPSAEWNGIDVWPGSKLSLGPLYNKEFPLATTSEDIANGKWSLGGFNEPALDPLALTPDPPPVPTPITVTPVEGLPFEGEIARFTDSVPSTSASEYTVVVQWGDGAQESGQLVVLEEGAGESHESIVFGVSAAHTYAEEGEYPLDVTISNIYMPDLVVTDESKAVVADAPLHATAHVDTTTTGETPALLWPQGPADGTLASFTDEDPGGTLTDYTATIEWGDGSSSAGEIAETEAGSHVWTVSGTHEYSPEDLGPHTVTVTVKDEGGSEATTQLTVIAYAYSAGGDFAIEPSPVGASVTFWGAEWAKDNPLVSASPSFKGFASAAPTPPGCGTAWESSPGDSSGPPASVPSYLTVIESSPVAKDGASISGQASGVVVVHADEGYGPAPGHTGTGEVIADVCG